MKTSPNPQVRGVVRKTLTARLSRIGYELAALLTPEASLAGGIASGMEMGFHLLRRAGYDEAFLSEVARVMEYKAAYDLYRDDVEYSVD